MFLYKSLPVVLKCFQVRTTPKDIPHTQKICESYSIHTYIQIPANNVLPIAVLVKRVLHVNAVAVPTVVKFVCS